MAEQDLDRNETATPYKLQKAREKGQVAKSSDVVSALVLTASVCFLTWRGWDAVISQFKFDQMILMQIGQLRMDATNLWPLIYHIVKNTLILLAPFFLILMLMGISGNLLQIGLVFSFESIKIDFDRINPVNGFKKIFSLRTIFDTFRACVKLCLLLWVSYYALRSIANQFYSISELSASGYLRTLLEDIFKLGLKLSLVLILIAFLDLLYTRREFAKKMRMSKRDLKDESKHREGDPRIRSRMRELRQEMRKRSTALQHTKNADVVLVNPTHLAVALHYVHGQMTSPQIVAKGAGHIAQAMRQIAVRNNIPVVRSPILARKLFKELDVDHHVPPEMFAEVARIIVWVFAMRDQKSSGMGSKAA